MARPTGAASAPPCRSAANADFRRAGNASPVSSHLDRPGFYCPATQTKKQSFGGPPMPAPTSRVSFSRRTLLRAGAGMAGILATGRAPAFAQTAPKKLVFAHINAAPESAAINFEWMAKEATAQSKGALDVEFFGKTLIPQELEIMNAVKSGSV